MLSAKRVYFAAALGFTIILMCVPAYAAETLYETKTQSAVCKGVTYEESRTVTDAGLLNIHVLKVDLTDPYITVNPVDSDKECGLKEPVSALLRESDAIAGVNSDFFGENGTYSAGFAPIIRNGQLVSISGDTNSGGNEFASLLLTQSDNPFISFIRAGLHFYNDGVENIEVHSINKVTDMVYPIIVNRQAMQTTGPLDSRFPGLLKVVVSGGQITYVSRLGETVSVPADGYVLVIQQASAEYFGQFFKAGQRAVLQIEPEGVDFSNIKAAIGGGGLILKNGEPFNMGVVVNGGIREPRTAVGINRDNTELIIVEVDGRAGSSIGATQDEMTAIMQRYGAYNAMHLDGGGSSTMVIKDPDDGYNVVNEVSDGAERNVIDALGIFSDAPVGAPDTLRAVFERDSLRLGESVKLSIYGLDAYGHRIDLDPDSISYDDPGGSLANGYFTPGRTGKIRVDVQYEGLQASAGLNVKTLSEVIVRPGSLKMAAGESRTLSFTGIDSDGGQSDITSGVTYEVVPPELGEASGGVFTAASEGAGYLKCTVSQVSSYTPIYIGDTGDTAVTLPDQPRFHDPLRADPNDTLTDPAVIIEGNNGAGAPGQEPAAYGARQNGRYAILTMTGAKGGLLATDPNQWRRFSADIDGMNPSCIVIETDVNPFNYAHPKEFELFHEALAGYQAQGKQVYVISKQGLETTTRIKDGIRYINIGAMWKDAENTNENYRVFRLYSSGDTFIYTLTPQ